jgi:hypothetical protein
MMRCDVVSSVLRSGEGWSALESLTHEPLEFSQGNLVAGCGEEEPAFPGEAIYE